MIRQKTGGSGNLLEGRMRGLSFRGGGILSSVSRDLELQLLGYGSAGALSGVLNVPGDPPLERRILRHGVFAVPVGIDCGHGSS